MARDLPTIPDEKVRFYRDKLWREVSNLFIWEGLPEEIPVDYLERTLVRHGRALFFYDEEAYGYMALETTIKGYNLYRQPTKALSVAPNDQGLKAFFERTIIHKYDEEITNDSAGVLINNMYNGESLHQIVDHYAYRLSLVQIAFDTNAMWQNKPVTWSVADSSMKLTIEKWFDDILTGKPLIVVDKALVGAENQVVGEVIDVPFILDKLYDAKNELYNEFKATIGLNAPGADKKERLVVAEATSNEESKENCLSIMLKQREIACEEINSVFGLNVSVSMVGQQTEESEGDDDGFGDDGIEESFGNE